MLDIDYSSCLRRGAVGACGSLPGTVLSHPFDVIKIRCQVSGDKFSHGIKHVHSQGGVGGFYRGFLPAIEQRIITRGPMFLVSELYTQIVMKYGGLDRTKAIFIGSVGSGFTTGSLASLAEYRKKLLSQGAVKPSEARWDRLIMSAKQSGNLSSIWRRARGAGTCSAVYDGTFFGVEHLLSAHAGLSPTFSFSIAAATAVMNAFAFDAAVAQMMVIPPNQPCLGILATTKKLLSGGVLRTYRGLTARSLEFSCNYAVVGGLSTYVLMMFD